VPGSEARDKIRDYRAAAQQEREEKRGERRQQERERLRESWQEKYAAMSPEKRANYRLLTLLGFASLVILPLFVILFELPRRWPSLFLAVLIGLALLPQLWRWIGDRFASVEQLENTLRVVVPNLALLLLIVV